VRKALEGLQFVDKSKPIYVDIKTKRAAFTVTDKQQFKSDEVLAALKGAGFPEAKVVKQPG